MGRRRVEEWSGADGREEEGRGKGKGRMHVGAQFLHVSAAIIIEYTWYWI